MTKLADAFWPGGLTIVLPARATLAWDLGDTGGTVALRMPDDRIALELLAETGPLAVSSANRTGQPAAQTVQDALDQLGDSIEVYLDAGATSGPLPSTIVDATGLVDGSGPLVVLREGVILREALQAAVPEAFLVPERAAGARGAADERRRARGPRGRPRVRAPRTSTAAARRAGGTEADRVIVTLLVALAGAVVSFLMSIVMWRVGIRFKLYPEIRERDVHTRPTPRLGGVAMYTGLLSALLSPRRSRTSGSCSSRATSGRSPRSSSPRRSSS